MIDTLKMEQAKHWLANAIRYEATFEKNSPRWHRMVSMALNKACELELEALGFMVWRHGYNGPYNGDIYAVQPMRGTWLLPAHQTVQ